MINSLDKLIVDNIDKHIQEIWNILIKKHRDDMHKFSNFDEFIQFLNEREPALMVQLYFLNMECDV